MQHNLKFGEVERLRQQVGEVSFEQFARSRHQIARNASCAAVRSSISCTSFTSSTSRPAVSLITPHQPDLSAAEGSQITLFLIDTLPIRITLKPFACIVGARSNRYSSE